MYRVSGERAVYCCRAYRPHTVFRDDGKATNSTARVFFVGVANVPIGSRKESAQTFVGRGNLWRKRSGVRIDMIDYE